MNVDLSVAIDSRLLFIWGVLSGIYLLGILIELRDSIIDYRIANVLTDKDQKIIAATLMRSILTHFVSSVLNIVLLALILFGVEFTATRFAVATILQLFLLCLDVGLAIYDRYRIYKSPD